MCEYLWDQVMGVCFITFCCFLCLFDTKGQPFLQQSFLICFPGCQEQRAADWETPWTNSEWRSWLIFQWPLKHKHAHYFSHYVIPEMQQKLTEALICLFTYTEGYILLQGSPADLLRAGHLMAPRGTLTCCCVSFDSLIGQTGSSGKINWDNNERAQELKLPLLRHPICSCLCTGVNLWKAFISV